MNANIEFITHTDDNLHRLLITLSGIETYCDSRFICYFKLLIKVRVFLKTLTVTLVFILYYKPACAYTCLTLILTLILTNPN